MEKEQYRAAKIRLVAQMQAGRPWQVAAAVAGVQTSQSTAYRLLQAVRKQGETAFQDGRHGHPGKLRGAVRAFLEERCRQAPSTASSVIQTPTGCATR
jgi:transposase